MAPSTPYRSTAAPLALWLFLMALTTTAVAVAAAVFAIDGMFERHERRDAHQLLLSHAEGLRDALDQGMEQHFQQVKVMSLLDGVARTRDVPEIRRALDAHRQNFPRYAWIGLAEPGGRVVAATGGLLEGANVAERVWFQRGLQEPFVGDVRNAVLLASLLPRQREPWRFVDFAVPVRHDGRVVGVLGAHLSWAWADELKALLARRLDSQTQAEILVLDAKGKVLLGPPAVQGSTFDLAEARADPSFILARAVSRGHGSYQGLGWQVVLRQPQEVAMADHAQVRQRTAMAALVVCLLVAPGLVWAARRLARPLEDITHTMNRGEALPADWHAPYREADIFSRAFADYRERQIGQAAELRRLADDLEVRVRQRTEALERSQRQMRAVTDNLPMLISYIDADRRLQFTNAQFERWTGQRVSDALGRPLREVVGDALYEQRASWLDRALAGERVEFEASSATRGRVRHLQTVYVPDDDGHGTVSGVYTLTTDVTELREAERRMADLAMNDSLTRLPNRRRFEEHLPMALARGDRARRGTALLFIDVDRFKPINDTHGHAAGDEVLKAFARRLGRTLRRTDFAARLAGDEFVVVLEGLREPREAERVAAKLVEAIRHPVRLPAGGTVCPTASIGAAFVVHGTGVRVDDLLAAADAALYRSKERGRDRFTCVDATPPPQGVRPSPADAPSPEDAPSGFPS